VGQRWFLGVKKHRQVCRWERLNDAAGARAFVPADRILVHYEAAIGLREVGWGAAGGGVDQLVTVGAFSGKLLFQIGVVLFVQVHADLQVARGIGRCLSDYRVQVNI